MTRPGRRNREDLPVALLRFSEEVGEPERRWAEVTYAVVRGERGYAHEDPAGPFRLDQSTVSFLAFVMAYSCVASEKCAPLVGPNGHGRTRRLPASRSAG